MVARPSHGEAPRPAGVAHSTTGAAHTRDVERFVPRVWPASRSFWREPRRERRRSRGWLPRGSRPATTSWPAPYCARSASTSWANASSHQSSLPRTTSISSTPRIKHTRANDFAPARADSSVRLRCSAHACSGTGMTTPSGRRSSAYWALAGRPQGNSGVSTSPRPWIANTPSMQSSLRMLVSGKRRCRRGASVAAALVGSTGSSDGENSTCPAARYWHHSGHSQSVPSRPMKSW